MTDLSKAITIDYVNWRGERSIRTVVPTGKLEFKVSEYHPEPQWVFEAYCTDRKALREFALLGIVQAQHPLEDSKS